MAKPKKLTFWVKYGKTNAFCIEIDAAKISYAEMSSVWINLCMCATSICYTPHNNKCNSPFVLFVCGCVTKILTVVAIAIATAVIYYAM